MNQVAFHFKKSNLNSKFPKDEDPERLGFELGFFDVDFGWKTKGPWRFLYNCVVVGSTPIDTGLLESLMRFHQL